MITTSTAPPYDIDECLAFIERLKKEDGELLDEYNKKYEHYKNLYSPSATNEGVATEIVRPEAVVAHFRPVLIIRDNAVVPEFVGEEVKVWKDRIAERADILNKVIPAVGRIEVNNNIDYKWVGTGWLVDTNIIVTNRHVASLFCENAEGFSFRVGYPDGMQTARLDFLEEDQRSTSLEFDIESVAWMSENDGEQPDVAFLRLRTPINGPKLPPPIKLAAAAKTGEVVATIGYPARDINVPNQDLVMNVFRNVFEKKRLAPGTILNATDNVIEHDCSTLGGNSGSTIISLVTGEAVGLHFAGIYMRANYAVPSWKITELLGQLKNGSLDRLISGEKKKTAAVVPDAPPQIRTTRNGLSIELNLPITITVEVGGIVNRSIVNSDGSLATPVKATVAEAVTAARVFLAKWPNVLDVRAGYRIRDEWVTSEEVVVVAVDEKKTPDELRQSNTPSIPQDFLGVGVDVRPATVFEQLKQLDIDLSLEAVPKGGSYREPPNLHLKPVNEKMNAIFHVSPDSAFPNLSAFIGRIEKTLTATMYEWDDNHISKAIEAAIKAVDGKLKMVTQRAGTKEAVAAMKQKLKKKFDHVFASAGAGKLIASHYHIKVASRDGEEFWLSSGNWKNSNQADIDPAETNSTSASVFDDHNREWNVIIKNKKLAELFAAYIDWDFSEAQRVPLDEAPETAEDIWLIVPEVKEEAPRRARQVKFFDPLVIRNEKLDIQPLLTPDRDDRGRRMFMVFATALLQRAKKSIYIQNQSMSLLDKNDDQFEQFFTILKKRQEEGLEIKIIFRSFIQQFGDHGEKTLEKLKAFGIKTDTDHVRVLERCHTKGIIIDPDDDANAAVLFGSHNLTNSGALFNRDASLEVRNSKVTRYFKEIFDYDWNFRTELKLARSSGRVRLATANETPAPGFKKIPLRSLLEMS